MTTTTASTSTAAARPTLWARAFASIYDPILWLGERRGQRARRRDLIGQARGLTVEIGAGTGLNLTHYPASVAELVLAEPDAGMRRHLERRAQDATRPASVIGASAEELPFADASVDTVVSTLVLCTVDEPRVALREIARVLAPDGQLLFIEHVRASSQLRARWQDRLEAPWRAFASGCRCNRPTLTLMAEGGFELDVSEAAWRGMPSIVKPLAYGRASIPG
ncbi:MAG TPA: class I SAM-dependent methyltransferase [Solirubrobacteraceae bacterium]|jgi:SAM-dependent methyltransferase|nr:class I SAM-dependent methyltransferase [Solirubrobacteraceae bacterium]